MPRKKPSEPTKLLQCRISEELWLEIEKLRHARTMQERRTVDQKEVVEELLRKAMGRK